MRLLLWGGPVLLLGVALFDLPYGYYRLLRVAIFLAALFHLQVSNERSEYVWVWVFGAVAVIYNPIATLSLGKPIWIPVNLATILIFGLHWRCVFYRDPPRQTGSR